MTSRTLSIQNIVEVYADIVVQKTPIVKNVDDQDVILVSQKYSISYVNEESQGSTRGRSGNPGYIQSLPLLVASEVPDDINVTEDDAFVGAKLVYENGYQVGGGDAIGNCISGGLNSSGWGDIN